MNDYTPLHYAAYKGREETVRVILELGGQIDLKCIGGKTPLMWAVHTRNKNMVHLLLDHGADVNIEDSRRLTALHYAAEGKLKPLFETRCARLNSNKI